VIRARLYHGAREFDAVKYWAAANAVHGLPLEPEKLARVGRVKPQPLVS
jgi:hypothetical protein